MPALEPSVSTSAGPELLLRWDSEDRAQHWLWIAVASLVLHVGVILLGTFVVPWSSAPRSLEGEVSIRPKQVTKLVAPRLGSLTQKSPNQRDLSKEFNLASLPPRPERSSIATPGAPAPPPRPASRFKLPSNSGRAASIPALPEAPVLNPNQIRGQVPLPEIGAPAPVAPPPRIQSEEKPKLAFERPGASTGVQGGFGRIPVARSSVEDAVRQAARNPGAQGLIIGNEDEGSPAVTPGLRPVPTPGKIGSSVELLSDPQGADFIPYLRAVLSAVRRNWYAVIPESARMGRTGRVTLQFAIDRSGKISKLVIATPSGARELDLAAVAGVSASDPFPPLPVDFKGSQVRLQFAFRYNSIVR